MINQEELIQMPDESLNKETSETCKYKQYLWNCHNQGDIWNEEYVPYSFAQWKSLRCPENGGIKNSYKNVI